MEPLQAHRVSLEHASGWPSDRSEVERRREGDLKATSLLFDIDTDEQSQTSVVEDYRLWMSARIFFVPQTRFEDRLLDDVRYYKAELLREEGQVDIVALASYLATIGYKIALRTAVGGGSGQDCFRNLCYQFLLVSNSNGTVEYVVDPKFREQFAISQSTPEYEKLLSLIPGEFVGTSARLRPLVKLLCLQMEQAFQDTGLTRPPWRQADSMMSKWLPSKSQDMQIDSPTSSPRTQAGQAVDGKSPNGPLSFCSSRTSSSSGQSPDRLRDILPWKYSTQLEPKRVQKGFAPPTRNSKHLLSTSRAGTGESHVVVRQKCGAGPETSAREGLLTACASRGPKQAAAGSFTLEWQPKIHTVKMSKAC